MVNYCILCQVETNMKQMSTQLKSPKSNIREIAKAKIKKHSLKSADVLCYQHFYS
jgi:hypothetical protein